MSVLKLYRVELIKLRRRAAFYLAVTLFVLGTILAFGLRAFIARGEMGNALPFELPRSAAEIHGMLRPLLMFFSFVTIVNLTAAEYPWRTARQNVIDGLSREQFFTAKLLLMPVVALLFFVLGYGIAFAIAATGGVGGGIAPAAVWKAMFGGLITAIGFSSFALFAAFATRHTAGAIAIVLGYLMFGETIIAAVLSRGGDTLLRVAAYLPANVFMSASSIAQYAGGGQARQTIPLDMHDPLSTPVLLVLALGYIVVFCGAAYAVVRRQDL